MPTPPPTSTVLPAPVHEVVLAALAGAGAAPDPPHWRIEEGGSSHLVVLAGECAVRVSRHQQAADDLDRCAAVVDALPELPFAVPRPLGPVVGSGMLRAVATRRVPGGPSPAEVPAEALAEVVEALAAVDVTPLADLLAAPLAYGGGPDWEDWQRTAVLPRMPDRVRGAAERAVDALATAAAGPTRFVHGDLAGANLRWRSGRVVGVIDWDLATAYDPALDLACLAEWHGWDLVGRLTDPATVGRARVQQDCFALHTVAHLIITRGPDDDSVRTAIERATGLLERGGQARRSGSS